MQLKFKVAGMVHRDLVSGGKQVPVVLVKLVPVDQVAGDVVLCVENAEVTYRPEEWIRDRDGVPSKKIIAADTHIQTTKGEAGGKSLVFVQDAEYLIDVAAV